MKAIIKRLLGDERVRAVKKFLGAYEIPKAVIAETVRMYQGFLDRGQLPSAHPLVIHLETRSLCNSRCGFCAAAITNPTRPTDVLMPDPLIQKVLTELAEIHYANRLSFYNNNEPFLDKRMFEIVNFSFNNGLFVYAFLR